MEPIQPPFALSINEGWCRKEVETILDLHKREILNPIPDDGHGHRALQHPENGNMIVVTQATHEDVRDIFHPLKTVTFTTAVLEAMLARSNDEHLERITIADQALGIACRLYGSTIPHIRYEDIYGEGPTMLQPASFDVVDRSADGWSVKKNPSAKSYGLPAMVKVTATRSRIEIAAHSQLVPKVRPLDPISNLRLEAQLGTLLEIARSFDTISL